MTTTTKRPTAVQMAAEVKQLLDDLDTSFPLAAEQCRRILNLGIPLAECLTAGLVSAISAAGREALTETLSCLTVIRDLMTAETYAGMVDTGRWTLMWDWAYPPSGVAFI